MKKIFIERDAFLLRTAVYEDNILNDIYFEKQDDKPKEGYIYIGEVKNILPSLKGAFLDIGSEKNVFLYLDGNIKIKKGNRLAVQIIKEEEGEKSAKSSLNLLLPGRYIMLQTLKEEMEFSKKLTEDFKENIRHEIELYNNTGVIIRSNSIEVSADEIKNEYDCLYQIYSNIKRKEDYSSSLGLIYDFNGILGKLLRDISGSIETITVNDIKDRCFIEDYIKGKINTEVKSEENVFLNHGIEEDIKELRKRRVILPSKGNIIIEKTEAMYVIDVNSSKNTSESSIDKTAFKTNIEAAAEIPRQIRLRGLSGIIIIDFIDLKDRNKKKELLDMLKLGFKEDRLKPSVYPFTELNLVQITRKKVTPLSYYLEGDPGCRDGKRLSSLYISILIKEKVHMEKIENPVIEVNNIYKNEENSLLYYLAGLIGENFTLLFKEQAQDFLIKH
ncbi:MAG: ribonuclease E/G [Bacillota bacterium]|nr:ribonuclease E/G [Bacillota bacterium]